MSEAWKRYLMIDLVGLLNKGKSLNGAISFLSKAYQIPEDTISTIYFEAGEYDE